MEKEVEGLKMKIGYLESIIEDYKDAVKHKNREANRAYGRYKRLKYRFRTLENYNVKLREILKNEGLLYKINNNVHDTKLTGG